jgi:hypothetical protein
VLLRLHSEFDTFFLGRLSRYPPALQTLIPTILVSSYGTVGTSAEDIFHMCLHAFHPVEPDVAQSRKLDSRLLGLYSVDYDTFDCDPFFSTMFRDLSRSGQYYVDDEKYTELLKKIIAVAYPL